MMLRRGLPVRRCRRRALGRVRLALCYWSLVAALGAGLVGLYFAYGYRGEYLRAAPFAYPPEPGGESCAGGRGAVADHSPRRTPAGVRFNVTTPANYRPGFAHPLLVVWAPGGLNEWLSERFTGLTGPATARGFVVVHVRSLPLGQRALRALAGVPGAVLAEWCIDPRRIAYTGHSDGGTVSTALAVLPGLEPRPAAIAPSAMGMQGSDLRAYSCPPPLPVMVMHNQGDRHFPDYGVGAAEWWAGCNRCADARAVSAYPHCEAFAGCAAPTLLCRAPGNHAHWPGFEHELLSFLEQVLMPAAPAPIRSAR